MRLPGGVRMKACPSQLKRGVAVFRGEIIMVMRWLPSMTMGRMLKVCGNMGTMTMASR